VREGRREGGLEGGREGGRKGGWVGRSGDCVSGVKSTDWGWFLMSEVPLCVKSVKRVPAGER
jgi:hypothetical protein